MTKIECEPGVSMVVLSEATAPEIATVPRSSPVDASEKSTLPLGAPEPGAFALVVAVMVTVWPKAALVVETAAAVVVASRLIVWLKTLDVLDELLASPE